MLAGFEEPLLDAAAAGEPLLGVEEASAFAADAAPFFALLASPFLAAEARAGLLALRPGLALTAPSLAAGDLRAGAGEADLRGGMRSLSVRAIKRFTMKRHVELSSRTST